MSTAPSHMRLGLLLLTFFFFTDAATAEIYTLSLHDALPISAMWSTRVRCSAGRRWTAPTHPADGGPSHDLRISPPELAGLSAAPRRAGHRAERDRNGRDPSERRRRRKPNDHRC